MRNEFILRTLAQHLDAISGAIVVHAFKGDPVGALALAAAAVRSIVIWCITLFDHCSPRLNEVGP